MSLLSLAQKTATATSAAVDSAQSQKLIHTMLGMSFGCVAFLRGLFPDDYFTDQRFIPRKFEKNYDPNDPSMKADALKIKTLVRGKSPQVDHFLDWLDLGVVDALRKGFLKSLILGIFIDEDKPEELHEVYTFSFDYTNNEVKLEMSQGEKEVVTLLDARQTLQYVMRRLIVVTQGLGPLPEKKFVTMRLMFTDSCPKDYQPPGFMDASAKPPAVIKTKKRDFESFTAGDITTGCHDINVKVFTSSSDKDPQQTGGNDQMLEIDPFTISAAKRKKTPTPYIKSQTPSVPPSHPHLPTQETSQTTHVLRSFLKRESATPMTLTQALKDIKCQCGSTQEFVECELGRCASCGTFVHATCYGIQGSTTIPSCYSCRSNTLGGIPLHSNLSLLMNARKLSVLLRSYTFKSITEIHGLLGGSNEQMTCDAISLVISLGLVDVCDGTKKASNVATHPIDVDISGIKDGDGFLEKDIYNWVYVPQVKRKSLDKQTVLNSAYKLLFQTTKGKCLSIDDELNQFTLQGQIIPSLVSDPVNSSEIGEDPDENMVPLDMNSLNIHEGDRSSNGPFGFVKRKRADSISQDSIVDSMPKPDTLNFSSNPVITQPRRKLRKTSAAVLSSLIE